jgi:hypothetical protein
MTQMLRCIEVAQEFPDAELTGINLSSANLPTWQPSNCEFSQHDVVPVQKFDIVYARFTRSGIRNCPTMDQVEEYLKPGGMIIWMAQDPKLYQGWPSKPFPQVQTTRSQTLVTRLSELTHWVSHGTSSAITEPDTYEPFVPDALMDKINKGLWSRRNLDRST